MNMSDKIKQIREQSGQLCDMEDVVLSFIDDVEAILDRREISIEIIDEKDKPIMAFKLKDDGHDTIEVNDQIACTFASVDEDHVFKTNNKLYTIRLDI